MWFWCGNACFNRIILLKCKQNKLLHYNFRQIILNENAWQLVLFLCILRFKGNQYNQTLTCIMFEIVAQLKGTSDYCCSFRKFDCIWKLKNSCCVHTVSSTHVITFALYDDFEAAHLFKYSNLPQASTGVNYDHGIFAQGVFRAIEDQRI